MKKNIVIFTLLVLLVISFGLNISYQYKNSSTTNFDTNEKKHYQLINSVINDFKFDDYEEILKQDNHMLALPLRSKENDLLNREKLFVFKSNTKDTVIMLNISVSKYNSISNGEWNHSFDYLPDYFNSPNEKFKDSFNTNLPSVQISANSFNFNGCNIAIIAFSNNKDKQRASHQLISFSNSFIEFIEKIK